MHTLTEPPFLFPFHRWLCTMLMILVGVGFSRAQEPAGDEPTAVDGEPTAVAPPPPSPVVSAALNAIRGGDLRTPSQLIKAVGILQQLGAYAEARSYLEQALQQVSDQAALIEVHNIIGTPTLLRLANEAELMPESSDFVRRVFAAVNQFNGDPQRIQQLVSSLSDGDREARGLAIRRLVAIGPPVLPALLDAVRGEDPPPMFVLDAVLLRLGNSGEAPLIAALGAPDTEVQAFAVRGLGRIGSDRSLAYLIRPYWSSSPEVSDLTRRTLDRLDRPQPSSKEAAVAYLRRRALEYLNGQRQVSASFDGSVELWTWSVEDDNVISLRLPERAAGFVLAARMARDAFELSPTAENRQLLLVTRLQVDQRLGGLDAPLPRGVGSAYDLGSAAGVAVLNDVLDYSLTHGYDAAAIGAAELIGDVYDHEQAERGSQPWSHLVRGLRSANRRVRFAAAAAIMKIDPRRKFAGSSFLLETLLDLANASGRPTAIVTMPRTEIRDTLGGTLASLGLSVKPTANSRSLLATAVDSSDVDVILISDSVNQPGIDETIQALRNSHRSQLVPVIVVTRQGSAAEPWAWRDPLVMAMPEFADEETVIAKLAEAEQAARATAVPPARRVEQARQAIAWLRHLAQYSQTYPWYDVMRARDVAIRATSQPALSAAAVDLLGYLGDETSQTLLTEMASQPSLRIEQRQRAANAFAEAVLRRGLRLRSGAVQRQYDLYQASEHFDPATQEVLGQILDVIETQTQPTALQKMGRP